MLPDIELDILRYFDRATLERLQMHSRYLRNLVDRYRHTLSLRYIHYVRIIDGDVYIQLLEDQPNSVVVRASTEQRLQMLFYRVNNAFIHRLDLSFLQLNLRLPYRLRAHAKELHCQIKVLRIRGTRAEIDYGLVDFLGIHLKPQVLEMVANLEVPEMYLTLFTHNGLRGSVNQVEHELYGFAPPVCIIPKLFGMDTLEFFAITTQVDPCPFISQFIEMFEMAKSGTAVVRSVSLLYKCFDEEPAWRRPGDPLGQPQRTDVPIPHSVFMEDWIRKQLHFEGTTEPTTAELSMFDNLKLGKNLEVPRWAIEPSGLHYAVYAFLLTIIDM